MVKNKEKTRNRIQNVWPAVATRWQDKANDKVEKTLGKRLVQNEEGHMVMAD
jgi:hypothetical protein